MIEQIALGLSILSFIMASIIVIFYFFYIRSGDRDRDERLGNLQNTINTITANDAINTPGVASLRQSFSAMNNSLIDVSRRVTALENNSGSNNSNNGTGNGNTDLSDINNTIGSITTTLNNYSGQLMLLQSDIQQVDTSIASILTTQQDYGNRINRIEHEVFDPNGLGGRVSSMETRLNNNRIP